MNQKVSVELCCGSLEDCKLAQEVGANSIELVTAHLLGGLTPSAGLLEQVKAQVSLPINPIIRPRGAGFCYSEEDFEVMCADARLLAKLGADGMVFGFLLPDGRLDYEHCARFMECIGDCTPVFHRAIDVVVDRFAAVESLISLGVKRILTSGGGANALDGAPVIRELVERYGARLQILAGGGIRANNIAQVVEKTGVHRVHFGGTGYRLDTSTHANPALNFGAGQLPPLDGYIAVNRQSVQSALEALGTVG